MILARKLRTALNGLSLRSRFGACLIALPCFGVVAAFGIAPDTIIDMPPTATVTEALKLPALTANSESDDAYVHQERIQRGDTVATLLARLQVDDNAAVHFLNSSGQASALNRMIPGKAVQAVTSANGKLVSLHYFNGSDELSVERTGNGYSAQQQSAQLERRLTMKSADIVSSLFAATDSVDLPDAIAIQIADIFSTNIDFHSDLRRGDRFSVVYEAYYQNGSLVKTGKVVAAEFINQGKTYNAVYFNTAPDQGGYYTLDGKNLQSQFLRSPLEFSRITSGYSLARFHPILQLWRSHKGVDFGAPSGTHVKATANGVVEFAGRQGGYGNLIVLRHQSRYTTYYGHLSGFANGLHKGSRVSQGDVIGYVGMTGLATGPHLHYEFRVDDINQNPLQVAMPAAQPISPEQKPQFEQIEQQYVHRLNLLHNVNLARVD